METTECGDTGLDLLVVKDESSHFPPCESVAALGGQGTGATHPGTGAKHPLHWHGDAAACA